jgi:hypothetical protein
MKCFETHLHLVSTIPSRHHHVGRHVAHSRRRKHLEDYVHRADLAERLRIVQADREQRARFDQSNQLRLMPSNQGSQSAEFLLQISISWIDTTHIDVENRNSNTLTYASIS